MFNIGPCCCILKEICKKDQQKNNCCALYLGCVAIDDFGHQSFSHLGNWLENQSVNQFVSARIGLKNTEVNLPTITALLLVYSLDLECPCSIYYLWVVYCALTYIQTLLMLIRSPVHLAGIMQGICWFFFCRDNCYSILFRVALVLFACGWCAEESDYHHLDPWWAHMDAGTCTLQCSGFITILLLIPPPKSNICRRLYLAFRSITTRLSVTVHKQSQCVKNLCSTDYLVKHVCSITISRNCSKKSDDDEGGFQQQNTQLLVDRYDKHNMNNQNEWWIIGLKMVPLAQFR